VRFWQRLQSRSIRSSRVIDTLYRTLLGRPPRADELARDVPLATDSVESFVAGLVASEEFCVRLGGLHASYVLNRAGAPMKVETAADSSQLAAMWEHVRKSWTALGATEPLWSVLTDDRYRSASGLSQSTVDEFYQTGRADLDYLNACLARWQLEHRSFRRVAEFGCGVGRMTHWLARTFDQVTALDVSATHLARAQAHIRGLSIANVEFAHITGRSSLSALDAIDLFYSVIVLQHNPPPVIIDILRQALSGLRPGGIAYFQVPTYSSTYQFSVQDYLREPPPLGSIEMHFVPQAAVLDLATEQRMRVLEVRNDHLIGHPASWISNSFLLQKPST
jgi:SAM-dependent methyltransferase